MANLSTWYESKTPTVQVLVDIICERTHFVSNDQEFDKFLSILASYNISTAKQFADSFFAEYEGIDSPALNKFIQDWASVARGCLPRKLLVESRAEQLWQEVIQFDFHKINFNGNTYFFKRYF